MKSKTQGLQREVWCLKFATVAAAPWLLIASSSTAVAAESLVISEDTILEGEQTRRDVTVKQGATLRVKPITSNGLGWLHLKAGRIVVEAGASIDATAAGFRGLDASNGEEPMGTGGGGRVSVTDNQPGGGGAHIGAGGPGRDLACTAIGGLGGTAYADLSADLLGSAGGAAKLIDPLFPSRGGHGGGRIVLEAAEIEISGTIIANGGNGISAMNNGSGGGAGGAIKIVTANLTGNGMLSAMGGDGATAGNNHGGGGGGGIILIITPSGSSGLNTNVNGGVSGGCSGNLGGAGTVDNQMGAACLDVDGDTHNAASCGGDDCDDADAAISPSIADDQCDGVDNDCNGAPDDALNANACPDNFVCQTVGCPVVGPVSPNRCCIPDTDAGPPPDGGPTTAPPDHLEYQGGCNLGQRQSRPEAWLLFVSLFAALSRRMRTVRCRPTQTPVKKPS